MTEPVDPFEALRNLNPVESDELRNAAGSPQATETLAKILSEPRQEPRRGRGAHVRRRLYPVLLVPATAMVVAVVAWLAWPSSPTSVTVRCFEGASLGARSIEVVEHGHSPTLSCLSAWRMGNLGSGPVPNLQACTLPSGKIAVFPKEGGSVCAKLGLAPK